MKPAPSHVTARTPSHPPTAVAHSFVDKQGVRSTFPLHEVMASPRADIAKRLKYTKDILHQLISGERK